MAEKQMNAVLRLRRDSENNFNRSNLILQKGEAAVVVTPFNGTQIKIGNGEDTFNSLPYETFGLLLKGYKDNDRFLESDQSTVVNPANHILFLDIPTGFMYYWDGIQYVYVNKTEIPVATDQIAGIVKLYNDLNNHNVDGAITQNAVVKMAENIESITFNMDQDDERLDMDLLPLKNVKIIG